jgi:hypothetical protein
VGSICEANANPDVAAIFSPAKITVEKHIVKTIPQLKPNKISWKMIGNNLSEVSSSKLGNSIYVIMPNPSAIEDTILTGNGTIREPKNGEATKNDPTRKDARNKLTKNT